MRYFRMTSDRIDIIFDIQTMRNKVRSANVWMMCIQIIEKRNENKTGTQCTDADILLARYFGRIECVIQM